MASLVNAADIGTKVHTKSGTDYGMGYNTPESSSVGGGQGHTHGLNNHTHSLNDHTHSINSHTHKLSTHSHTPGMPANISVYGWKRTA